MLNGWKVYGKFKTRQTDNQTYKAIDSLEIPSIDNLADVLGFTRKHTLRRVRRLEANGQARKKKVDGKLFVHLL